MDKDKSANKGEKLERIKNTLYKVTIDNPYYQAAIEVIKHQTQQTKGLQSWNNRYREKISLLTREQKKLLSDLEKEKASTEKYKIILAKQVQETQRLIQERQQILKDLQNFDRKLDNLKTAYEKADTGSGLSLWDRIQAVLVAVKDLLSPDIDHENHTPKAIAPKVEPNDPFQDQPWMKTDPASINRDLLDR